MNTEPLKRDDIFALASGSLPSAISIIRLSGPGTFNRLKPALRSLKNPTHELKADRKLRLCGLYDPGSGELIDELMAVYFKGPHSYTGEDSAELQGHGGPYVLGQTYDLLLRLGFREALPGELSRRAYLNGKMDLTKAEGIQALIQAETKDQWLSARQLSTGKLRQKLDAIREGLIHAGALLAAKIDFSDEGDTQGLSLKPIEDLLKRETLALEALHGTYEQGQILREGFKVLLLGPPNAGKSSLLNALLGEDRAIVSDEAGTTRDYIEAKVLREGQLLRFFDTAGLRETASNIEKEGIKRSLAHINDADLILWLCPSGEDSGAYSSQELPQDKLVKIASKADLSPLKPCPKGWLPVHTKSAAGLKELSDLLVARARAYSLGAREDQAPLILSQKRHAQAVALAIHNLKKALELSESGMGEELVDFELKQGLSSLASIVGEVGVEDILDQVFSRFCLGK